ncbi:putative late blight resistance protein homolog R1C-3 [Salvia miltiorrhiza]|uniref:putative late blight resistance protein homolog R1C-3 n=1 Tax=Salvia miltiorrhiza TaxID=226208 RepID=UPI0025AD5154|nr:putative late blight resistance protein homolog R1C-3 [Salvia miltiorrhiza]
MSTNGDSVDNVGRQSDSPAVSSSSRSALNSEDFDALDGDPTLATKLFVSSNRLARLADRIQWTARDLIDNSTADGSSPTSALKSADFDGFDEDLGSARTQILHFSGVLGRLAEEIMSAEDYAIQLAVGSSSTSSIESEMASEQFLQISDELERLADGIMSTAKGSVDNVGRLNDSPPVATELTDSISNRLGRLAERIKSTAEDSVKNIGRLSDSPAVGSSSISALKSEDFDGFDQAVATELTVSISNRLGRLAERIKWTAVGSSSRSSPTRKDVVVGFDEDRLQIMPWLTSYSSELQVLPIVGMGGIGKSTLAKIVYDDTFITYHFDFHAWVTISKDYSVESILSNLLASMKGKGIQAESDLQCEEKESEIYKYLKGRRYLIVMEDMWSTVAWDQVQRLLPDDNNGSRIILTTRLKNVATYASSMSPIHTMHFLDDQQSWRLFQKKVFGDQDCPVELQDIGKKYVKRCEGLPLSIVTVAGLLSKIDRTPKLWKRIGANDGQLETILLSLSYKHLPRHLRECFLYMAGFPKDYEIRVSELIKLWVAEGFLEGRDESKTLEEVAEDVLEVLVEQSLVLVTSKKSDGKIKRCKLHSVVRDFCSRQAGEEKFLLPIMDYFPNPIVRRHFLPQVLQNHQRVSVSWHDLDLKDSTHSSCTRSIICISQRGYRPKGSIENFKSLKVLHVLR